jgi:hypothetical protein
MINIWGKYLDTGAERRPTGAATKVDWKVFIFLTFQEEGPAREEPILLYIRGPRG